MAIRVKHGANPSAVLGAAFGVGREGARKRVQDKALVAGEARRTREDVQAQQQLLQRRGQEGQAILQTQRQTARTTLQDDQQKFRKEQQERRQVQGQEDYEYKQSAQQEARMKEIDDAIDRVETNEGGQYSPEDQAYALRELRAKKLGIKPQKQKRKFPKGQGVGEVWRSDDGRTTFTRDADNKVRKLSETPQVSFSDVAKARSEYIATRMAEGKPAPTKEEINAYMNDLFAQHKQLTGGAPSGQPAPGQAGQPSGPPSAPGAPTPALPATPEQGIPSGPPPASSGDFQVGPDGFPLGPAPDVPREQWPPPRTGTVDLPPKPAPVEQAAPSQGYIIGPDGTKHTLPPKTQSKVKKGDYSGAAKAAVKKGDTKEMAVLAAKLGQQENTPENNAAIGVLRKALEAKIKKKKYGSGVRSGPSTLSVFDDIVGANRIPDDLQEILRKY